MQYRFDCCHQPKTWKEDFAFAVNICFLLPSFSFLSLFLPPKICGAITVWRDHRLFRRVQRWLRHPLIRRVTLSNLFSSQINLQNKLVNWFKNSKWQNNRQNRMKAVDILCNLSIPYNLFTFFILKKQVCCFKLKK